MNFHRSINDVFTVFFQVSRATLSAAMRIHAIVLIYSSIWFIRYRTLCSVTPLTSTPDIWKALLTKDTTMHFDFFISSHRISCHVVSSLFASLNLMSWYAYWMPSFILLCMDMGNKNIMIRYVLLHLNDVVQLNCTIVTPWYYICEA